jgi:hypothetical protein
LRFGFDPCDQDTETTEFLACTLLTTLSATRMLTQRACARVAHIDSAFAAGKASDGSARALPDSLLANGKLVPAASAAVGSAQM